MGNCLGSAGGGGDGAGLKDDLQRGVDTTSRIKGFTQGRLNTPLEQAGIPKNAQLVDPKYFPPLEESMDKLLVFKDMPRAQKRKVLSQMWEIEVEPGQILIQEGATGDDAQEMYVVKSGYFEVFINHNGARLRVNRKETGDVFGEVALLYDTPRNATVAATSKAVLCVLNRYTFRSLMRGEETSYDPKHQINAFLNSVPIAAPLDAEQRTSLIDACETCLFRPGEVVFEEGSMEKKFYIVMKGEAVVTQQTEAEGGNVEVETVNHLFPTDFFGETSIFDDKPRNATVTAAGTESCVFVALGPEAFMKVFGQLQNFVEKEKLPEVIEQKMRILNHKSGPMAAGEGCSIIIHRKNGEERDILAACMGKKHQVAELQEAYFLEARSRNNSEEAGAEAQGHKPGASRRMSTHVSTLIAADKEGKGGKLQLELELVSFLGGGAFSKVHKVVEPMSGRTLALKTMRKVAMLGCQEHVMCEKRLTENCTHPFAVRQYASFQDSNNLYLLFDYLSGGDLMDILVAEAKVITKRGKGFGGPKKNILKGLEEEHARFFIASLVVVLEYLHSKRIVYRDLKPENIFVDKSGYIKLGDFGFAKELKGMGAKTYTFCGTPGYVAPENVLANGYGLSVDWWGLGVLMYVLLTGRQPFSHPKVGDPMVILRRIVDPLWPVNYPFYMSKQAQDLIQRLLERKATQRLGCLEGGVNDIKNHPWFNGFDWAALSQRKMPAPNLARKKKDAVDAAEEAEDLADLFQENPDETEAERREATITFKDF